MNAKTNLTISLYDYECENNTVSKDDRFIKDTIVIINSDPKPDDNYGSGYSVNITGMAIDYETNCSHEVTVDVDKDLITLINP
jgi:hypothetical protein